MLERMLYWLGPWRFWLWALFALLLLYTLGGFLLAPWLIERQLVSLSAERADLATSVDNIDINPYTLTFNMEGLQVTEREGAPLLALERLFINFELVSVVRRAWNFNEFHLMGLEVALERFSDGDTNIGAVAERWMATAEPKEQTSALQEERDPVRLVIADLLVDSAALSLVDNLPAERFETRVEALDLSVQNLSTLPDDSTAHSLSLTFDNDAVFTWTGTSSLNPLHSAGRVTLQGAYLGLAYEYFQDLLPFDMGGGEVDAKLAYRAGAAADGALSAEITDIQLKIMDTVLSDSESGEPLVSLPEVTVENGELRWPANTVSLDALRLRESSFHPVREQDGTINFVALMEAMSEIQDETGVDADKTTDGAESWQLRVGELALEEWLITFKDRVPQQEAVIELGLNATLADLSTVPDSRMRLASSVEVASGGTLSLGGTLVALPQLQFDGELALDDLELALLQPYIEPFARVSIDQGRLGMDGTVAVTVDNQSYRGNISVNELALTDRLEDEALFTIDTLQINGIALQQSDEPRLDVDEIRITSPYAKVEIDKDGSTNIGRVLVSSDADDDAATSDPGVAAGDDEADVAEQPMALTVDRMVVDSARVDFADWSLPLPFAVFMSKLGGEISALSTRSEQPAAIDLEGQVGEYGLVTVTGKLRPLAYAENTQVELVFRNIDMPAMSPYVIRFAGWEIDDGRLDVDLSYRIEDGEMTGGNEVVMRDLVLGDRVAHPEAMDLPLGLAVALLRDRNGAIHLDLPVSGDINNPEFSYGRVIRAAITNVLANIVTAPFRFLAGLVDFGGGDELAVIKFAPGRSDVTPPQRQKLATLAKALEQRPQLQLRVPPVYSRQLDEQALAQRLLDQRIEERMNAPAESGEEEMTAGARRVVILERMMAADGLEMEEVAKENEKIRLDELAYTDLLRTTLLAQQSVPSDKLKALARERAQRVLAVITEFRPELEAQIGLAEITETQAEEEGQVVMTLEVETKE